MIQDMSAEYHILNLVILPGVVNNVNDYLQETDIFCFFSYLKGQGLSSEEAETNGSPCAIANTIPNEVVVIKRQMHQVLKIVILVNGQIVQKLFLKVDKSLNREDFINNHYDIDLEAKVVQDILLQND